MSKKRGISKKPLHKPKSEGPAASPQTPLRRGLVVARFGATVDIEDEQGDIQRCISRRKLDTLVCGDRVEWEAREAGRGVVFNMLPRTSLLSQLDDRGRSRAVAANIDQLIVVSTAVNVENGQYGLNCNLVDRYIVAAEASGIEPLLIFNKIDLLSEEERVQLEAVSAIYSRIGYRTLHTSTKTNVGEEQLNELLMGQSSVFVGESGVGKSSILNYLLGSADARIGENLSASGLGRHTTTTAMLYHLERGGDIIDSPGVREFHLNTSDKRAIAQGFREFLALAGQCKFNDCLHIAEPGCAIKEAAKEGAIHPLRLASYRQILTLISN